MGEKAAATSRPGSGQPGSRGEASGALQDTALSVPSPSSPGQPECGGPAAAKPLQPVRLCDPIDGSPPGSRVPGILQARTLELVAISFSNA